MLSHPRECCEAPLDGIAESVGGGMKEVGFFFLRLVAPLKCQYSFIE